MVYDPFVGTGSMAYVSLYCDGLITMYLICPQTTAHFGALVYGSDIDGRQMRGKGMDTLHPIDAPCSYMIVRAKPRHPTRGSPVWRRAAHRRSMHL